MPYRQRAARGEHIARERVAPGDREGTALLVLILGIGALPFVGVGVGHRPAPLVLGGATVMVTFAVWQLAAWLFAPRHRRAFDSWRWAIWRRWGWWRRLD